jgi:hypothetical protein
MMTGTAWKSGLLVALGALCSAGESLPVKMQIVVYNGAALTPKTVSIAEDLTGTILRAAGVEAEWRAGPVSDLKRLSMDFTARSPAQCTGIPTPGLLRVQLLPRAPSGLPAQALGFSLPCALTGIQVTLYADGIARVSEKPRLHSPASKTDWQHAAVAIIPFSPPQQAAIMVHSSH